MNFDELVVSLVCWCYSMAWIHTCIHFRAEIVECQRLMPREFGHFFSARWFCSSVGVQCNTVQSLCDFMCNIGRFGNSQDCVDACPRLNWFKNVKINSCGPTNQSINWTKLPQGSARNSSWLTRAWRKLWYSANNFDTRTLKANHKAAKRWIILLKSFEHGILIYSCNLRWMKPENIRFESIWSIIITIITSPDHNPKNRPQQISRNWRFVLWSITLPLPSSWSAMSRGAGLRGPNLGTWRGRCPKFPKFRAWDRAGLVQNDSNAVSSNILYWPQMRF